jgi:hypothetical protein
LQRLLAEQSSLINRQREAIDQLQSQQVQMQHQLQSVQASTLPQSSSPASIPVAPNLSGMPSRSANGSTGSLSSMMFQQQQAQRNQMHLQQQQGMPMSASGLPVAGPRTGLGGHSGSFGNLGSRLPVIASSPASPSFLDREMSARHGIPMSTQIAEGDDESSLASSPPSSSSSIPSAPVVTSSVLSPASSKSSTHSTPDVVVDNRPIPDTVMSATQIKPIQLPKH